MLITMICKRFTALLRYVLGFSRWIVGATLFLFLLQFTVRLIIVCIGCGPPIRMDNKSHSDNYTDFLYFFEENDTICPEIPPNLVGKIPVLTSPIPTIAELEERYTWLSLGGHYQPEICQAREKLAIIVPFRNRRDQLMLFLQHIHPFLKRQLVDYTIYVVEQDGTGIFNKAMIMNIAFKEALKLEEFDCFIFHDVDLLPEHDHNLYRCTEDPRHLSVAVDQLKYRLPYETIFGGVVSISRSQFQTVNGFSNEYWGWGAEDDDLFNRIVYHKMNVTRYPVSIARYTMLSHRKEKPNPQKQAMLKSGKDRFDWDGLSNLNYSMKTTKTYLLYTWFLAEIKEVS